LLPVALLERREGTEAENGRSLVAAVAAHYSKEEDGMEK
jgi:hypothetical protein